MWPENSNVILLSRHKKCLAGSGWTFILLRILFPISSSHQLGKAWTWRAVKGVACVFSSEKGLSLFYSLEAELLLKFCLETNLKWTWVFLFGYVSEEFQRKSERFYMTSDIYQERGKKVYNVEKGGLQTLACILPLWLATVEAFLQPTFPQRKTM